MERISVLFADRVLRTPRLCVHNPVVMLEEIDDASILASIRGIQIDDIEIVELSHNGIADFRTAENDHRDIHEAVDDGKCEGRVVRQEFVDIIYEQNRGL